MKIIKKILKGTLILLLACIILSLAVFGYILIKVNLNNKNTSTSEWINSRWENVLPTPLPKDLFCTYSANTLGWQGDGYNYCVFSLENINAEFLTYFSSEKDTEFESAFTRELNELDGTPHWNNTIVVEKRPDWSQTYNWAFLWQTKDLNENGHEFTVSSMEGKFLEMLYMAYFPECGELYTFELLW